MTASQAVRHLREGSILRFVQDSGFEPNHVKFTGRSNAVDIQWEGEESYPVQWSDDKLEGYLKGLSDAGFVIKM